MVASSWRDVRRAWQQHLQTLIEDGVTTVRCVMDNHEPGRFIMDRHFYISLSPQLQLDNQYRFKCRIYVYRRRVRAWKKTWYVPTHDGLSILPFAEAPLDTTGVTCPNASTCGHLRWCKFKTYSAITLQRKISILCLFQFTSFNAKFSVFPSKVTFYAEDGILLLNHQDLSTRLTNSSNSTRHGSKIQLDDGWPESVEEQGLLLLVWRRNFRNDVWKMCYRQSRRGVSRPNSEKLLHTVAFTQTLLHRKLLPTEAFTYRSFYTDTFTHRYVYTQTLLHTDPFTHRSCFYTQMLVHTEAFTHRRFYTQALLHTNTFTQKHFYTQTLLHADAFTHRRFYTQRLLHTNTFTHKHFYTQTLLHTDAFTHRRFDSQTLLHGHFYTQTCLHTDTFTHRPFYTDIPSSETKAFNALIPSLRTWRKIMRCYQKLAAKHRMTATHWHPQLRN